MVLLRENLLVNDLDELLQPVSISCDPCNCKTKLYEMNFADGFKIITENIRSLSNNFAGFQLLMHQIDLDYDVIVLTECWLTRQMPLPHLDGYLSFATKNVVLQNDGVVIYVNKNLENISFDEPVCLDANCAVLKIGQDIAIIGIYRSPSQANLSRFLTSLEKVISSLSSFKNVVILGAMNININEGVHDNNSQEYLTMMSYPGYLPKHCLPTRNNNCLDHLFAKTTSASVTLVTETTLTDHYSVIFYLQITAPRSCPKIFLTKLDMKAVDIEMCNLNLSSVFDSSDANIAANELILPIINILQNNTTVYKLARRKLSSPG